MAHKEMVKVGNKDVSFVFSRKTGSISNITDVKKNKDFLSEPSGARLFRMIIPLEKWPTHYADSHINNLPEMNMKGNNLEILFSELKDIRGRSTGIRVLVNVSLSEKDTEAIFSMHVENKGRYTVEEVRFPWVGGFRSIAGPGKDKITIESKFLDPHTLFPLANPHTFSRWREKLCFDNPYLPYLDVSGGNHGIGYICYLQKSYYGTLGFEHLDPFGEKPSLSFAWASSPFIKPGRSWTSPKVGISIHRGDWHRTADRFRNWAYTWWKDPDPPARLRKSLGIVNLQFTSFDGESIHKFSDLPELAEDCIKSGIKEICVWHRAGGLYCMNGSTKEIMDEPPAVLKELKSALSRVKKKGVNASIILNLRLMKTIFEPYKKIGEPEAMRTKDGSPASRESYSSSPYHLHNMGPVYNNGDCVPLCQRPDSPFSERARKIIEKMLGLGFTSIFIDQPFNAHCCFAKHHKHLSPDLARHDCVRWMAEVSRQVKSHSRNGYVIGECPELFQSQNVDLWWYWQWRYLAPEVYRYSHPKSLQLWVIDGDVGEMNRAFALGFYLNLTPSGMEKGLKSRPEIVKQCRLLANLKEQTLEYLTETRFADREGLEMKGDSSVTAAVYTGNDISAVTVAETQGIPADIELRFNPEKTVFNQGCIYRTGDKKGKTLIMSGGVYKLRIKLRPYEVAVWTLKRNSPPTV